MVKKDPGLAAVFSAILPGLGQIYNEDMIKGVILFFLSIIIVIGLSILFLIDLVAFRISYISYDYLIRFFLFCGLLYIPIWLIGVFDAHAKAIEKNEKGQLDED